MLRRFGFDAAGLEPDQEYARHARQVLGVPVDTGFVQDVSYPSGAFDVVTMYHALEHVEDPLAILSRIRSWMAENGGLLIEVPNVEARCIAPGHRFHFAHFYNFNRGTLEAFGRKAGFEPVQTTTSPDGGNLITVFRAVPRAMPAPVDSNNYARVAAILRTHSALKYYWSPHPYRGALGRLRAYFVDRHAMTACNTPRQVMEKLIDKSGEAQ